MKYSFFNRLVMMAVVAVVVSVEHPLSAQVVLSSDYSVEAAAELVRPLYESPKGTARWSASTNIVDYVNLGTLNAEVDLAVARRWTLGVQARYNNWNFGDRDSGKQIHNRKASYAVVGRYYPWHIYSGWFFLAKGQYQEYNRTNMLWNGPRSDTEEGDAFGLGFGFGYDHMIHPHVNLEFGMSGWGGYKVYTKYDCPTCGVITGQGSGFFALPDLLFLSVQFVF